MSVIAHIQFPAETFELGRIMRLGGETTISLESMVPLGETAVPLFTVYDGSDNSVRDRISDHPSVKSLKEVSSHGEEVVFALDWNVERDVIFQGLLEADAHLLSAKGTADTWEFELRFPDHDGLSSFKQYCVNANIPLDVGRIYNPTRPGTGQWYGLTTAQKDALLRAVGGGYYSIPRAMSTQDLAEELDISDQAVTERLRRGIVELVESTLLPIQEEQDEFESVDD